MKKREHIVFIMFLFTVFLLSFSPVFAEETGQNAGTAANQEMQDGIQGVFGELFSSMGEIVGGMTKGMQDGAKEIQNQLDSATGVKLIANKEQLLALTETKVLKAEQMADNSWKLVLAVKNTQEYPVRLANLTANQNVLLLDQEDFAYEQKATEQNIVTVPERAALKVEFFFPDLDGSTPKTFRLYGQNFTVPQAMKKNGETNTLSL